MLLSVLTLATFAAGGWNEGSRPAGATGLESWPLHRQSPGPATLQTVAETLLFNALRDAIDEEDWRVMTTVLCVRRGDVASTAVPTKVTKDLLREIRPVAGARHPDRRETASTGRPSAPP